MTDDKTPNVSRFRYFRMPHRFSSYTAELHSCEFCGRLAPGYDGPFYGEGECEFICEDCLASGRLSERGFFCNEGDLQALSEQLSRLNPSKSAQEIKDMASVRDMTLTTATPHLVTWQDFSWPAHCGDYMEFIQEVGQADLSRLASGGDGSAFLARSLSPEYGPEEVRREYWNDMRASSPLVDPTDYSSCFYLYRCLTCNEHLILMDYD